MKGQPRGFLLIHIPAPFDSGKQLLSCSAACQFHPRPSEVFSARKPSVDQCIVQFKKPRAGWSTYQWCYRRMLDQPVEQRLCGWLNIDNAMIGSDLFGTPLFGLSRQSIGSCESSCSMMWHCLCGLFHKLLPYIFVRIEKKQIDKSRWISDNDYI